MTPLRTQQTSRSKRCLLTANVRNFKQLSFPEERQLFIAELKYRQEELNGFPETRVTRVRLAESEGGYYRDPVELFDMTQFAPAGNMQSSSQSGARLRQTIDHSVSFETTPDAAHTLAPGDYIRVGVSIQHQERWRATPNASAQARSHPMNAPVHPVDAGKCHWCRRLLLGPASRKSAKVR